MILDMALLAVIAFNYKPVNVTSGKEEIAGSDKNIEAVTSFASIGTAPPPSGRRKSGLLYYLASLTKDLTAVIESSSNISNKASRENSAKSMEGYITEC